MRKRLTEYAACAGRQRSARGASLAATDERIAQIVYAAGDRQVIQYRIRPSRHCTHCKPNHGQTQQRTRPKNFHSLLLVISIFYVRTIVRILIAFSQAKSRSILEL